MKKSKSLTAAEVHSDMVVEEDRATAVERLRSEESPPSLEEVRDRRASIMKQRRDSINMIRTRTASRASTSGRPSLEDIRKNGGQVG